MGSMILKEIKNRIHTRSMVKYGEAFKGRHTALNTRCSQGKEKSVKVALGNKEHINITKTCLYNVNPLNPTFI